MAGLRDFRLEFAMLFAALLSTTIALLLLYNLPQSRGFDSVLWQLQFVFEPDVGSEHWWWPGLFWLIVGFLALGLVGRMFLGSTEVLRTWASLGVILTLSGLAALTIMLELSFRKLFPPGAGGWAPGGARAYFLWPLWAHMLLHAAAAFMSGFIVLLISRKKPTVP